MGSGRPTAGPRLQRTRDVPSDALSLPDWHNWVEGRLEHPVNNVGHGNAARYCAFVGKALPSEAQWELAARGTDGRLQPWGDSVASCSEAVVYDEGPGCGCDRTWPVGTQGGDVSPYGVMDMAGNVSEWASDGFDSDYFSDRALSDIDPRVGYKQPYTTRGANFNSHSTASTTTMRTGSGPLIMAEYLSPTIGFRCALAAPVVAP